VNVLLYVIDALRADHVSCYGYDRETTPTIDGLAADGVRFDRCYTPATWTRPVAASLLTGLYPPAHGTRTRHDTLTTPVATLAERFSESGYETVGVTSMGNVSTATQFDRGFDQFFDLYRDERIIEERETSTATEEELQGQSGTVALPRAEDITKAFTTWFDEREDDQPFFAFCWSIEPHMPYDPPRGYDMYRDPEYDGPVDGSRESLKSIRTAADLEALKARYDEEIRYNDECLGELISHLRSAGELDETLVVVVGDHGDAFEEHGRLTHGHAPYEELARVPWVVRPPDGSTAKEVKALTGLVDVAPTLVEYATDEQIDLPNTEGIAGKSVADAFVGAPIEGHDRVYFETKSYDMQNGFYGIRTNDWKYIEIEERDRDAGTALDLLRYVVEKGIVLDIIRNPGYYWKRYRYSESSMLFNLVDDPGETENLISSHPEVGAEFEARLTEWRDVCQRFQASGESRRERDIDEQTMRQLRELGYTE
jgi:arylsulfatase A-like enzyme